MISTSITLICVGLLTLADGQRGKSNNSNSSGNNNFDSEPMQKTETDIPISIIPVQGVVGQTAYLPCDTHSRDNSDVVTMVLWFKESTAEPVYSYDARIQHRGKAKLWSAENVWGNRATFRAGDKAHLVIQNVQEGDAGVYRCRVDFRDSQTKNVKVNFTIIGRPKPRVSWYLGSQLINSTFEQKLVKSPGTSMDSPHEQSSTMITSRVTIRNLKRSHHHAKLSCRASNTQLSAPQTTTVVIELNLKPLKVEIIGKEKYVSASKKNRVECRSSGSKPPAMLQWYKGSKQLVNSSRDFQKDGESISILEWVPDTEDEGKYLTCRAENRHLPDATIEDKWKLNVLFAPIVLLKIGSSFDLENIKEGDDVYFECNVRSNPTNFKLTWYHGNKEVRHNASAGVLLSDQSLVLQGITREASGNYSCLAATTEGRNRSNIIYLHVMYAPICKQLSPISLNEADAYVLANVTEELQPQNVSRHEIINLMCEVEASPSSVTFHWTFNNSHELKDVPESRYTSDQTVSRLSQRLKSDEDYGTFGCWASNVVGHSKQPCLYHLPTPVNPLPLQNCTAHNQSGTWIRISCVEGFDGGLPQKFVAVADEQRFESSSPYWEIEIHKPTTVSLYAVNAKGSSEPIIMEGIAFKDMAKFTGETGISLDISPILIGLGGTATGLGLIVTGVLMALWRKHAASPSKPKPPQQPSIATFAVKGEEEDGNPDLIPTTALTNNYTDRKLSVYGSLPRRSHYAEDQQLPQSIIQDMDYPRAAPNTYYSLQRPSRYTETIVRHTTVQESCI
ncbi:muscle M-line assembly protein unc-89 isoform X2 [Nasonia vitripennis]|uniref:Ig-like domain-containing protein n=1 Tax=Nasonia vitripennis TaxID=7425 RepID=A0A7M7QAV4_NASVI|nr:muscle M-line assembly protein unc-89 isoform X2 [Nasonia vitripennis]